jgi:hypothetical protein
VVSCANQALAQILALCGCLSGFIIYLLRGFDRPHFLATSRRTLNMYCERAVVVQGNHCTIFARQEKVRHFVSVFFLPPWLPVAALSDGETNARSVFQRDTSISSLPYGNADGHARDASRIVGDGMAASLWLTPLFIYINCHPSELTSAENHGSSPFQNRRASNLNT